METIQKMYEHLNWSNHLILDALKVNKNPTVLLLFSHILMSERVWLTRLEGKDSSHLAIWKEVSLETCAKMIEQNELHFSDFTSNRTEADLDQMVSYKNSKGKGFQNTIRDILIHVALHGQYHRGQINMRLREGKIEPVNVDYITYNRPE